MSDTAIFKAAVKLPPEGRTAYLDQACGANDALRQEVESLLETHDQPGSFLGSRLGLVAGTVAEPCLTEKPGTVIGAYKLLQQVGEGGMGAVFMAEQERPANRGTCLRPGQKNVEQTTASG